MESLIAAVEKKVAVEKPVALSSNDPEGAYFESIGA